MLFKDLFFILLRPLMLSGAPRCSTLSVSTQTDDELFKTARVSPLTSSDKYMNPATGKPNSGSAYQVAADTVMKRTLLHIVDQERLSMDLVRQYTSIPVPLCERVIKPTALGYSSDQRFIPDPARAYVVQQFIPGRVLHDAWPSLSWWMRFRVVLTLRYYVHQLRSISHHVKPSFPGPPSSDGLPQRCIGHLSTSWGDGPFPTYHDLERWYNNRLLVVQRFRKEGLASAPFDATVPLVFTHNDLHCRNLILGDDGHLWVIDWTEAGWYPSWFEAASMHVHSDGNSYVPSSWGKWIDFIAGDCEKPGQLPFIRAIGFSLLMMPSTIINLIDS